MRYGDTVLYKKCSVMAYSGQFIVTGMVLYEVLEGIECSVT